jgi:hypothetical protein
MEGLPHRGVPQPDEEDGHYDVVKQEADEAMEDATPPAIDNLPPEYHAVLATWYDEDALPRPVFEAAKADIEASFLDL